MLQFSSESRGFCRIPVTEWDICCGSTGQREGGGCSFFDPTGGAWRPVWRRWWRERYGWSLVQFLIFSSFLSPHGIVFLFYFYSIQPSLCWLTPFFCLSFFWRGLMESRFHYNNVLVMWAFWEARCGLRWLGHGLSQVLLFNQTYVLGNVRPELFFVYNCRSFLSVAFIFYNRYSCFYLLYLVSKGIFHPGVLISITHTNIYMSFTEWEWYCFFSFVEYNFEIVNI